MARTLKYDIPGVDWRRSMADSYEFGVHSLFQPEFARPFPLVVEIGFGRGEFLLELAAKHPEVAFVGIEVSWKRVLKMARKVARAELENVRLVAGRGEAILQDCLPERCVRDVWVNFSDPWPKASHAHRRIFQPPFIRRAAEVLEPGGVIHIATDDPDYAAQIDEVLSAEVMLVNLHGDAAFIHDDPNRIATSYEMDWRAAGRSMHFFDYTPGDATLADAKAKAEAKGEQRSGR